MSNVLERYRGISDMEFYRNARRLNKALIRFLMSDRNLPKKWRSVYAYPTVLMMEHMFDLMYEANRIYTRTAEKVAERKELQDGCIDCCVQIFGKLQRAAEVVWDDILRRDEDDGERIRIENHLTELAEMLDQEITLLEGWKASTKLMKA